MEINRLKWTKKIMAHLFPDLRHIERILLAPYRAPREIGRLPTR
jgi:hypothetical protein